MKHLTNQELADIFADIADFLEAKDVPHKPTAYRNAADYLTATKEDIAARYFDGGAKALEPLPAIGESIAKKIGELLDTGQLKYYEKLKKQLPVAMGELTAIEGIGPKTVYELYKKLKIRNLADIERAARQHKISQLEGFTKKTEDNILAGLKQLQHQTARRPLRAVQHVADNLVRHLKRLDGVKHAATAGSIRRRQATIGDIDLVAAASNPATVIKAFCNFPDVVRVYSHGDTKALVRLKQGIDADLRVVSPGSYGAALQYFTGPKDHSIATRELARDQGLKLNEYGLFKGKKKIAGATEKGVYQKLKLTYQPPSQRSHTLPTNDD